jgi:hypothetical protein
MGQVKEEARMKILRHPPAEENWSIKQYCTGFGHGKNGCGARLKVDREDLRYRPFTKEHEGAVTFKCVCCGELNDIGIMYYPPHHKDLKPYKKSWIQQDA